MTDIDTLAASMKAGLDADEEAARAVGCSKIEAHEFLMKTKWLVLSSALGFTPTEALPSELADHIVRQEPARTLRDVEAKRRLLDLLLAEKHGPSEEARDDSCRAYKPGHQCECGRDARVTAYLTLLAEPYLETA